MAGDIILSVNSVVPGVFMLEGVVLGIPELNNVVLLALYARVSSWECPSSRELSRASLCLRALSWL